MSLFTATLVTALVLLSFGLLLLWNGSSVGAVARAFPRSRHAAFVTMSVGTVWTLYHVWHLGEADFGDYRVAIFVAFGLLAVLAFLYVPDFLAVRGACVLALLSSNELLGASYMRYEAPPHLVLNSFVYVVLIPLALWLAVSPFRVRDFVQWLFARPNRARAAGAGFGVYGAVLLIAALRMS